MTFINLFIASLFFVSAAPTFAAGPTKYKIEGMTCGGCVDSIKAQVCSLPGVETCNVKVGEMELSFKSDSKLTPEKISEAVSKAGYTLKK